MLMTPFFRKFGLTAHITFSVGWFGAVAGFLALAIAGLTSENPKIVVSSYISMDLITWFVIVPACFGTLITGVIQSLATQWGLFRYYWILAKFLLTIVATIVLLVHMQPIRYMADIVAGTTIADSDLRSLRIQLIADAGAALLVLLVATTLSVYKPWGLTSYGQRKLNEQQKRAPIRKTTIKKSLMLYILLALIALVILGFIILHLTGGGFGRH
ncbi:MAG: hypothetical protein LCH51_15660 [Bacteroidetes bacterium]|nr:hypothetical protein [Bacteroidota bacterium]